MAESLVKEYFSSVVARESTDEESRKFRARIKEAALPVAKKLARYRRICLGGNEDYRMSPASLTTANLHVGKGHIYIGQYDPYYKSWDQAEFTDGAAGELSVSWDASFPIEWIESDTWEETLKACWRIRLREKKERKRREKAEEAEAEYALYLRLHAKYGDRNE